MEDRQRKYRYASEGEVNAMQGLTDDGRGIACKVCGCRHHRTLETAHTAKGSIRRRRECRHCGLRFTTYEEVSG